MAGIKGKSGRKARTDGKVMKAVSLYIPMQEIDVTPYGKSAKYEWVPEAYFRKFKRYFGARWQDKVRWAIGKMVEEHQALHLWKCQCTNEVVAWHKKTVDHCPQCNYRPTEYERHKSYHERKINETVPIAKAPIKKCGTCGQTLEVVEGKYGKTMYCKSCNPNRLKL